MIIYERCLLFRGKTLPLICCYAQATLDYVLAILICWHVCLSISMLSNCDSCKWYLLQTL